ncbi:2794_t:CDS:2 [Entrophospora sp. SA101]|nr:2794_t:CDS:2 [Entrophospora sp. SA101]
MLDDWRSPYEHIWKISSIKAVSLENYNKGTLQHNLSLKKTSYTSTSRKEHYNKAPYACKPDFKTTYIRPNNMFRYEISFLESSWYP